MRTTVKALNSKPQVSLVVAVGRVEFVAESLADAAILTAIANGMLGLGNDVSLWDQIAKSAKAVAKGWRDSKQSFEMKPPRRKAKA